MEEFKEYSIHEAHTDEYDVFVVCLTFESVSQYLDKIEQERLIQDGKGSILIDQLLTTGNGTNRFLLCEYDNGKILIDTARNIKPDETYREKTVRVLNEKEDILHNSILTDAEKEKVLNKIVF